MFRYIRIYPPKKIPTKLVHAHTHYSHFCAHAGKQKIVIDSDGGHRPPLGAEGLPKPSTGARKKGMYHPEFLVL